MSTINSDDLVLVKRGSSLYKATVSEFNYQHEQSDQILVQRSGTFYWSPLTDAYSKVQSSDICLVERSGTVYKVDGASFYSALPNVKSDVAFGMALAATSPTGYDTTSDLTVNLGIQADDDIQLIVKPVYHNDLGENPATRSPYHTPYTSDGTRFWNTDRPDDIHVSPNGDMAHSLSQRKPELLFNKGYRVSRSGSTVTFDGAIDDCFPYGDWDIEVLGFRKAKGFFDFQSYQSNWQGVTINHDLGVTPQFILIMKERSFNQHWISSHTMNNAQPLGLWPYSNALVTLDGDYGSASVFNTDVIQSIDDNQITLGGTTGLNRYLTHEDGMGGYYRILMWANNPAGGIRQLYYTRSSSDKAVSVGFRPRLVYIWNPSHNTMTQRVYTDQSANSRHHGTTNNSSGTLYGYSLVESTTYKGDGGEIYFTDFGFVVKAGSDMMPTSNGEKAFYMAIA